MSSIFFSRIASLHKFCFVLFECFHIRSCCSIFNDQPQPHSVWRDSLYIIPHSFPFVNTFFKSFFAFFKVFFIRFMRSYLAAFLGSPNIIPLSSLFVNPFSETFFNFSRSVNVHSFYPRKLCKMHNRAPRILLSGLFYYLFSENYADQAAASLVDNSLKCFGKLLP